MMLCQCFQQRPQQKVPGASSTSWASIGGSRFACHDLQVVSVASSASNDGKDEGIGSQGRSLGRAHSIIAALSYVWCIARSLCPSWLRRIAPMPKARASLSISVVRAKHHPHLRCRPWTPSSRLRHSQTLRSLQLQNTKTCCDLRNQHRPGASKTSFPSTS